MSATRLGANPIAIRRFDVIGEDGTGEDVIRHVGLAAEASDGIHANTMVLVHHMGPPLARDGEMHAHVRGQLELTDDEQNQIKVFVDEHAPEGQAEERTGALRRYVVRPHADWLREEDGTPVCRRFSCAGFVIEAYAEADLPLVVTDEGSLPPVSRDALTPIYPQLRDHPAVARKVGLGGDGPWPVVMPGYIFHSLARDEDTIRREPHTPVAGNEKFPR